MQESVRDETQAGLRFVGFGQHRLTAHIPRCRHQRSTEVIEQQMVQRAVWQHDTDVAQVRRDAGANGGLRSSPQDDNRAGRVRQSRRLLTANDCNRSHLGQSVLSRPGDHHGERLCGSSLALPKPLHGRFAARITHEVISPDAAYGNDPACT